MRDGGAVEAPRSVIRGESRVALSVCVDWLAFTCFPGESWREELRHFLRCNFGLDGWDERRGWQGYECSARVDGAIVAWGGEAQRGSVHVEIPGSSVAQCRGWPAVIEWLECMRARLTRVDIAGDDYEAQRVSVAWGLDQYRNGGFVTQGRPPSGRLISDLEGVAGDTLYIGKRENGKLLRVYEKGKQLGDALSKWVRCECEWRAKDRVLSFDMLLRPAEFLAGAFPCLSFFADVQTRVRAFRDRAHLSYQKMVAVARQHAGRALNAILMVTGGDVGAAVSLLRRSGLPARLNAAEMGALIGGS